MVCKLLIGLMWLFMMGLVTLPVTHLSAQTEGTPTASATPTSSMADIGGVTPTPTGTPMVELTPTPTVTQLPTPIVCGGITIFDFEDGAEGWVGTRLWHRTPRRPPESSYDATMHWWFGDDASGTYDVGESISGTLTSPRLYFLSSMIPVVLYAYRYDIERRAPQTYDLMRIQMSQDDGATWRDIEVLNEAGLSSSNGWTGSVFRVPQYMGHIVMMRFIFDTIDGQENSFEGWYVDDVQIRYMSYMVSPTPPAMATLTMTPSPTGTPTAVSTPRPVDTTELQPLPVTPSAWPSVTPMAQLIVTPQLLPMTGANLEGLVP